jgi:putative transposase
LWSPGDLSDRVTARVTAMILEQGNIYHVYNQGNDRELIFFRRENYHYFLNKISVHILPYADLLAWCLMPNHFHLMIAIQKMNEPYQLNNSIAVMLRSYTRAINIQEKRTGALFREGTKAEFLDSIESGKLKMSNRVTWSHPVTGHPVNEEEYLQTCFKYIMNNPVKARLVKQISDWEFSSFREINNSRDLLAVNKTLIEELGLVAAPVTG